MVLRIMKNSVPSTIFRPSRTWSIVLEKNGKSIELQKFDGKSKKMNQMAVSKRSYIGRMLVYFGSFSLVLSFFLSCSETRKSMCSLETQNCVMSHYILASDLSVSGQHAWLHPGELVGLF